MGEQAYDDIPQPYDILNDDELVRDIVEHCKGSDNDRYKPRPKERTRAS